MALLFPMRYWWHTEVVFAFLLLVVSGQIASARSFSSSAGTSLLDMHLFPLIRYSTTYHLYFCSCLHGTSSADILVAFFFFTICLLHFVSCLPNYSFVDVCTTCQVVFHYSHYEIVVFSPLPFLCWIFRTCAISKPSVCLHYVVTKVLVSSNLGPHISTIDLVPMSKLSIKLLKFLC